MLKGIIFDIKRYAIHDGPGIRTTVFFKGCPLRCPWCHNPEGQEPEPEIVWHSNRCPTECRDCLSICLESAIKKIGKSVKIDLSKCNLCGECLEVCAYEALEIIGREITVQQVMEEIEKDRIFFENSEGGVTISGGEPLMQPDFLEALLDACGERAIHTTLDTCGYTTPEILDRVSDKVNLYLYDMKLLEDERHKEFVGTSNKPILENLKSLSDKGKRIIIRIPLMAAMNDDDESVVKMAEFLLPLKNIKEINLLPYHKGGAGKYKRLKQRKIRYTFQPTSEKKTKKIEKILEDYGFSVKVGG